MQSVRKQRQMKRLKAKALSRLLPKLLILQELALFDQNYYTCDAVTLYLLRQSGPWKTIMVIQRNGRMAPIFER
jgi:hypothetical protein